jgi:hypothetical protein
MFVIRHPLRGIRVSLGDMTPSNRGNRTATEQAVNPKSRRMTFFAWRIVSILADNSQQWTKILAQVGELP